MSIADLDWNALVESLNTEITIVRNKKCGIAIHRVTAIMVIERWLLKYSEGPHYVIGVDQTIDILCTIGFRRIYDGSEEYLTRE